VAQLELRELCTLPVRQAVQGAGVRQGIVRAWNAKEAEEHIRASLRDNGVRDSGTLLIRDRKGAEILRSGYAYEPA